MGNRPPKRKSFDGEGHIHEFTFSTYRRQPFFMDDVYKRFFLKNLEKARKKHGFLVWAYVLMPEHAHLLIPPQGCLVRDMLKAIKQPVTQRIVAKLKKEDSSMLLKMVSGSVRGHSPYSFWQVGGGYDRDITTAREVWDAIEYIHLNPMLD